MILLKERLFSRLRDHAGAPALTGQQRDKALSDVKLALRDAIRLELSTIPVYLYALYSLDEAKNGEIANRLRSVVKEEMLHMTLACNVLNALAGEPLSPVIYDPVKLPPPTYPGPLPGGVEAQLTVHLAPFSMGRCGQIETFLTIEEPEGALIFPVLGAPEAAGEPKSIGQFYSTIRYTLERLDEAFKNPGDGVFIGDPKSPQQQRQVDPTQWRGDFPGIVKDLDTAKESINTIIDQGEGTTQGTQSSPLEGDKSEDFAHYYRFQEIKQGKKLIKNPYAQQDWESLPDQLKYVYAGKDDASNGEDINFDSTGVYRVLTDPTVEGYRDDTSAQFACKNFNYAYTNLLQTLEQGFGGDPSQIWSAINMMDNLENMAKAMMSGKDSSLTGKYKNVGPSFELQTSKPGS